MSKKLRVREAASYLGLGASTLGRMRTRGDGPPYAKCGPRIVVYDLDDLDQWLRERIRHSTSDIATKGML